MGWDVSQTVSAVPTERLHTRGILYLQGKFTRVLFSLGGRSAMLAILLHIFGVAAGGTYQRAVSSQHLYRSPFDSCSGPNCLTNASGVN